MSAAQKTNAAVIDQMDQGMDLLSVIWCSLRAEDGLEDRDIESITNVLFLAMTTLRSVRAAVNKAHGENRI